MKTKVYVKEIGDFGMYYLVPMEDYNWTGKWKSSVIDGKHEIFMERRMMLFGIIPTFLVWVGDEDIVFREEDIVDYDCLTI